MERTYHIQVSWPQRVKVVLPRGELSLSYSNHAKLAAKNDRYGDITNFLPTTLNMEVKETRVFEATVIESEQANKLGAKLVKFGVRLPIDSNRDLVMVVTRDNMVKTVWVNHKNDKHVTLRRELYSK